MGKAKNSKKYRKKLTAKAEPIQMASSSDASKTDAQNVISDISSMDAKRRERACVMIANIFGAQSSHSSVIDRMSTSDLLGKLCMRLIDSSENVRTHAAGAIRNMASSRTPIISQRLIDAGIVGTIVSLVSEGLQQDPISENSAVFIEQLISTASNLSASCEGAVEEILSKQFLAVLLQTVQMASLPASLRAAATCCLYTVTDSHTPSCEYLFSFPDGLNIVNAIATGAAGFTSATATEEVQLKTQQLYAVGVLANINLSFLAAYREDGSLSTDTAISTMLSKAAENMQSVLSGVLSSLQLREDVLLEVTNAAVDDNTPSETTDETSLAAQAAAAAAPGADSQNIEDLREEARGDLVYVAKDVDRKWALELDVVEIASEILANMSCVVRNSFLDDVVPGSYHEHGQTSGTGDYEWEDDDEASEQKMEAMARSTRINGGGSGEGLGNDGQHRRADSLSFDTRLAVISAVQSLEQMTNALDIIAARTQQQEGPFTSPGLELVGAIDRLMAALTNLFYLMDNNWNGEELASVLQSVLHTFSTLSGIFIGVTDAEEASSDGSLQDGNLKTSDGSSSVSMVNHWTISPAVSVLTLQRAVRSCLITCSQGLSTLHDAQKEGMCMLQAAAGDNFKKLRDDEVECLTKGITSVPILEVIQPCFEAVSQLVEPVDEASGQPLLSVEAIKYLSEALICRVSDPGALRVVESEYSSQNRSGVTALLDGSLLVMEGCISTLIDLHSSDDLDVLRVYSELQLSEQLQEAYQAFRTKLRVDGGSGYDRDEVGRCKETLLNLKRFLKYKEQQMAATTK